MAYGARLESVLGASPRGFESPILRNRPRATQRGALFHAGNAPQVPQSGLIPKSHLFTKRATNTKMSVEPNSLRTVACHDKHMDRLIYFALVEEMCVPTLSHYLSRSGLT